METLDLTKVLDGKHTYPVWSSGKTYPLEIEFDDNTVMVTYKRRNGGRRPRATYPRFIKLTPNLAWVIGFLKGEGSQSRGNSAYRRFTVTNNNPQALRFVINTLKEAGILNELSDGCVKIGRSDANHDGELLNYWSNELGIPKCKFYFPPKPDSVKRAKFGTCHIYISNVLLRLTIDAIAEYVFDFMNSR